LGINASLIPVTGQAEQVNTVYLEKTTKLQKEERRLWWKGAPIIFLRQSVLLLGE
jgi:hypothetical protein